MALADRRKNPPAPTFPGKPCSVAALLDDLEGAERDALVFMLESRDWTASMIYDALYDEGHKVGFQTIGRHRGGKCKCRGAAA